MALPFDLPASQLTEAHLERLALEKTPENHRLDYKLTLILDPVKQRKELLKDITAMANADGGVIIYGIDEVKHPELGTVAGPLSPLADGGLPDRANRICRASISPPVSCIFHIVAAEKSSGFYLVVEVHQSPLRPHAFTWNGHSYWYLRRGQDNFPMTELEIRELYRQSVLREQSLNSQFEAIDRTIPGDASWQLICKPHAPGLHLIDTIATAPRELVTRKYIAFFGGSDGLRPAVDRFEEIKTESNINRVVRIFSDGAFIFGESHSRVQPGDERFGTAIMYRQWVNALQFLHETYSKFGYYGQVRVWLVLETLGSSKLAFAFRTGSGSFRSSQRPYLALP